MASDGEHSHPFRVREVKAKIVEANIDDARIIEAKIVEMRISVRGKFRLPILARSETNLPRFDSQIASKTSAQQGSADNKLIARSWELETRGPLAFFRIE